MKGTLYENSKLKFNVSELLEKDPLPKIQRSERKVNEQKKMYYSPTHHKKSRFAKKLTNVEMCQ